MKLKFTGFFTVVLLLLGGLLVLWGTNIFFPIENDRVAIESVRKSEKGIARDKIFTNFYYPQTFNEVSVERYQYLIKNGSFEKLRNHSPILSKATENEWLNIGPFGITACSSPGARNDYKYSGRIISLAQDWGNTDIMYLGAASGGLWKSTDRGVSWTNIFDNLAHPSVGTIATNPKVPGEVWIGTGDKGNGVRGDVTATLGLVFRSIDYGNTWQQIVISTNTVGVVYKILIRPGANSSQPDAVFIATNIGLFRSEDRINWTRVLEDAYSDVVYIGSVFNTDYKIVAARWKDGDGGIFYSNNQGLPGTFTQRTLPGSVGNHARTSLTSSLIGYNQKVYANVAATNGSLAGIWRSDDGGNNWELVTDPYSGNSGQMNYNNTILVEDDILSGNTVYTGTNSRELFKSTNGGITWTSSISDPFGVIHEDQQYIHDDISMAGRIYVANDGGLYKSTNRGSTFSFLGNEFLSIAQIYNLTVSPEPGGLYGGSRYYIATQDNGIQRGPDGFLQWFGLTCCDGFDITFKDQTQYNTIVTGNTTGANRIQRPAETGVCDPWLPFTQGLPNGNFWGAQLIFNGNHFYFKSGVNGILYRANNGVLPWSPLQNFNTAINSINVTPENRVVVGIAATIPVSISNLANTSFISPTNPSGFWQGKRVTDISFGSLIGSSTREIFLSLSGTNGIRIARSTDNGETFIDASGDLPNLVNVRCILIDPTNNNVIYIGTDFGVYVSFNRGTNWHNYSNKLPGVCYVMDLEFDPYSTKIVAATYGRGVFIADRATATSVEDDIAGLKDYKLFNNYPNPFNPVTTIKYSLGENAFVSLKIYDITGKEITTLVNEEKSSGVHEILFNASNLASGSYFYTIKTPKFSETKKLVLLK